VKAGGECAYAIPARPKRRIGNGKAPEDVSREELIQRVRRYEALFRKHGVKMPCFMIKVPYNLKRTLSPVWRHSKSPLIPKWS